MLKKPTAIGLNDPLTVKTIEGQLAQQSIIANGKQTINDSKVISPYTTVSATSNTVTTTTSTSTNIASDTTTTYSTTGNIYVSSINQTIRNSPSTAGVTSIIEGNNISITSTGPNGTGDVTITSIGGGASGYSGISGYSGASTSGYSGVSGFSGSGVSGYSGISGYSGANGTGTSGYSGYSGGVGTSGYSGISGYSGANGTGTSGYSGYSGGVGTSGYSGISGYSGADGTGTSGYSGYSGKSGFSGVAPVWKGYGGVDYAQASGTISLDNSFAGRLVYMNDVYEGAMGTWTLNIIGSSSILEGTIIGIYSLFSYGSTLRVAPTGNVTLLQSGNITPVNSPSFITVGNGKLATLTKIQNDTLYNQDFWVLSVNET